MTTYNPKLILTSETEALVDLTLNKKEECAHAMVELFHYARKELQLSLDNAHDYAIVVHVDRDHREEEPEYTDPEHVRDLLAVGLSDPKYLDHADATLAAYDRYIAWGIRPHQALLAALNPIRLAQEDQQEKLALAQLDQIDHAPTREALRAAFLDARMQGASVQEAKVLAAHTVTWRPGQRGTPPAPPPPNTPYIN